MCQIDTRNSIFNKSQKNDLFNILFNNIFIFLKCYAIATLAQPTWDEIGFDPPYLDCINSVCIYLSMSSGGFKFL